MSHSVLIKLWRRKQVVLQGQAGVARHVVQQVNGDAIVLQTLVTKLSWLCWNRRKLCKMWRYDNESKEKSAVKRVTSLLSLSGKLASYRRIQWQNMQNVLSICYWTPNNCFFQAINQFSWFVIDRSFLVSNWLAWSGIYFHWQQFSLGELLIGL